jgi:hypothetical protein
MSALISSSDNPSLKYWFSGSALMFANGSTAIDFSWLFGAGRGVAFSGSSSDSSADRRS